MKVTLRQIFLVLFLLTSGTATAASSSELNFFESKVRPILARHCYECHSAEAKKLRANLYLDSKQGWVRGGDSGMAIVPGDVENSLLIHAVRYTDADLSMPPRGRLTEAEVADLERWVELGAPDPRTGDVPTTARDEATPKADLWSFKQPQRHPAPKVQRGDWPANDVDRFILAKLEEKGLEPAATAATRTLLRRVTFDLTGLPPTRKQIAGLLADSEPGAFGRYVDSLLESPQFGEHWGRHWLDLARYADSNGGDINLTFHNSWRYRDYVVRAFNQDKPYDDFIREQLAGDLLKADSLEEQAENLTATGFLIVGPKMLSERDKEKLYMDVADEQIDTIGRTFMGLTLGCARCHDHKFDPVTTEDYYGLAGIFRSTETVHGIRMGNVNVSGWLERELPVSPERRQAIKQYDADLAKLEGELKEAETVLNRLQADPREYAKNLEGIVIDDALAEKVGTWKESTYSPNFVGAGYIHDDRKEKGSLKVIFRAPIAETGNYEVRISFPGSGGRDDKVPVRVKHADGEKLIHVDQTKRAPIANLFLSLGTFRFEAGQDAVVTISNEGTTGYVIADSAQFIPEQGLKIAEPKQAEPSREEVNQLAKARKRVDAIEAALKHLKAKAPEPIPMVMAVQDRKDAGDIRVCIRGVHSNRGDLVKRGLIAAAAREREVRIEEGHSGRERLAEWVASPDNPLTARVYVNRVWHHLFGFGLVTSVDNFGHLGALPTHPELLDDLAVRFMENGWSTKWLIRELVTSRTYQMASEASPEHASIATQADPENRLLWRQHRRRMPAESIRDGILAVSGSLDLTRGGTSVAKLGEQAISNSARQSGGVDADDSNRRSLYLPLVRNDLPSFLTVFDFADPDVVTGDRSETTVPAQALLMMNSDFVRREAQRTAERAVAHSDGQAVEGRIRLVYEWMLGRLPTEPEMQRALEYLADVEGTEAEVPAWSEFCQVMFASTEFRFLE